jgi:hypothetical protein
MALVKCPDCGTECSDQANACPKCGRPLGGQKSLLTKSIGCGGFIYAMMLIIGLLLGIQGNPAGWLLVLIGAVLLFVRLKAWSGVKHQ